MVDAHTQSLTASTWRNGRTALLLTASLFLSAVVAFALPTLSGVSLVSLMAVVPLGVLARASRQSAEPQLLWILVWMIVGATVAFVVAAVSHVVVQWVVLDAAPSLEASRWGSRSTSSSSLLPMGLAVGAVTGLRWPDRLLIPRYGLETSSRTLRILANIAAIVLTVYLVSYVIGVGFTWSAVKWLSWRWFSLIVWGVLPFWVVNLAMATIILTVTANLPMTVPSARRVITWGTAGMIVWFVAAVLLQLGLFQLALSSIEDGSEFAGLGLIPYIDIFGQSLVVFLCMGLTIGAWTGLTWPERLCLPRWLSGDPHAYRVAKNLAGLALYSVCAFIVFWPASFATMILVDVVLYS